jgi:hypothetical protein
MRGNCFRLLLLFRGKQAQLAERSEGALHYSGKDPSLRSDDIAVQDDLAALRIKHIPLNRNLLIFRLFQINSIACTFAPVVIS